MSYACDPPRPRRGLGFMGLGLTWQEYAARIRAEAIMEELRQRDDAPPAEEPAGTGGSIPIPDPRRWLPPPETETNGGRRPEPEPYDEPPVVAGDPGGHQAPEDVPIDYGDDYIPVENPIDAETGLPVDLADEEPPDTTGDGDNGSWGGGGGGGGGWGTGTGPEGGPPITGALPLVLAIAGAGVVMAMLSKRPQRR